MRDGSETMEEGRRGEGEVALWVRSVGGRCV